jgi:hypothetical protein
MGAVEPLWQAVIWSAIPVALLIIATAAGVYALSKRQPRRREDPVERAYLDATAHEGSTTFGPDRAASRDLHASSR